MFVALFALGSAAWADPEFPEEEEEVDVPTVGDTTKSDDWGFSRPADKLVVEDDNAGMTDFVAEAKKKAPPPAWFHLDPSGKTPLTDAFDIQIEAYNETWVVVSLPVLVANGRASFELEHPGGLLLIGEITSGGLRVVQTQIVTADAVLETGPTLVFLKTALPNPNHAGDVRFLIRTGELPPPPPVPDPTAKGTKPPPPPPPPAPPKDRYARTTVFMRK